jgi:mannose/fructose/N-acetylgalactosamine-specific phosphotransferase system component IID
LKHISEKASSK